MKPHSKDGAFSLSLSLNLSSSLKPEKNGGQGGREIINQKIKVFNSLLFYICYYIFDYFPSFLCNWIGRSDVISYNFSPYSIYHLYPGVFHIRETISTSWPESQHSYSHFIYLIVHLCYNIPESGAYEFDLL